jgi:hypothetical protein
VSRSGDLLLPSAKLLRTSLPNETRSGGTDASVASGGALTAGVSFRWGPLIGTFSPLDVTLYPDDSSPYYTDYFDNGQSRCRDSRNGQFATDASCVAVDASYAFSADAVVLVPSGSKRFPLLVGGPHTVNDTWEVAHDTFTRSSVDD